tara:strand:+ start:861 stop:1139 length:279 start_codon:yes stop_codon:yes gene_type:complete
MADECPTCFLLKALLQTVGVSPNVSSAIAYSPPVQQAEDRVVRTVKKKAKKKVSKYQREFGKQLKQLKKKHPRTAVKNLMKKAHKLTKKIVK